MSVGLGIRHRPGLQSLLSLTLPTSTGPDGYGESVPSVALLNTLRAAITSRLTYEGSLGVGFTPTQRPAVRLAAHYLSGVSAPGLRQRVWGAQSLYGNLFYHSPYYQRHQPAGARPAGALSGLRLDSGDTRGRRVAGGAD